MERYPRQLYKNNKKKSKIRKRRFIKISKNNRGNKKKRKIY